VEDIRAGHEYEERDRKMPRARAGQRGKVAAVRWGQVSVRTKPQEGFGRRYSEGSRVNLTRAIPQEGLSAELLARRAERQRQANEEANLALTKPVEWVFENAAARNWQPLRPWQPPEGWVEPAQEGGK